MLNHLKLIVKLAAGVAAACIASGASAQAFPSKPIKIITPFGAGQGPEVLLRLVAEKLQTQWGQAVVVENRPGASGFLAFTAAKAAPADGYTLVNIDNFHIGTHPYLFKKQPYDAFKDFDPVTPLVHNYFFIVVSNESKWKTVADLVAAAKAQPERVTYGSWAVGSPAHLGGALLGTAAGVKMTHVAFKEPSQLYQAVASGEVDWAIGSAISTQSLVQAGKLKLLAAAAPSRIAGFEKVPTIEESGGPKGVTVGGWNCLLVPAGTPKDVIAKLNDGVRRAMASADIKAKLAAFTYEDYTMSPEKMGAVMLEEPKHWGPVIKANDIRID